jgi:hypothetical protein
VRNKHYDCLYPGCSKQAINSHSIPQSSILDALSQNGHVYTLEPSFTSVFKLSSITSPVSVVRVGVKQAGTFPGFCAQHDHELFERAENPEKDSQGMYISLHMRALALEYCRKRMVSDFLLKLSELIAVHDPSLSLYIKDSAEDSTLFYQNFCGLYLNSIFELIQGCDVDSIKYFCIPMAQNLKVSCCGAFQVDEGAFESAICYNIISHSDVSILVLSVFEVMEHYLDSFLSPYSFPLGTEALINEIAFRKCEEPLIAPDLWEYLSDDERLKVRLSLRHPAYRDIEVDVRPIKVQNSAFYKAEQVDLFNHKFMGASSITRSQVLSCLEAAGSGGDRVRS